MTGNRVEKNFHPPRAGDQAQTAANYSKAEAVFNFLPKVTFQEGIIKQIEWQSGNQILD
jgi:UDP-glucose 4-epimerase